MDNRSGRLGLNLTPLSSFVDRSKAALGTEYLADTMLRLDSSGTSSMYDFNLRNTKRKWDDFTGDMHPSLVLGLGRSPSSSESSRRSSTTACTMSSTKETEEEASMDLDLKFQLHLGNDNTSGAKKLAVHEPEAFETQHMFDLQLSLSTEPSESIVTSITRETARHQNVDSSPMISSRTVFDDGSTSSRWKIGNLIPPLCTPEAASSKGSPVQATTNLPSTIGQNLKSPVALTSGATQPPQRNSNTKSCQFQGCSKGARGASGLCIAHGGGRRCKKLGCNKGAEGKTVFCKAHGGGRRCMHLGCTKSAESCTEYCIAHGGGHRCTAEGCPRAARGKSGLCIRHGGGKRCQRENCTKSAEGRSGLCISHGGGRRCQFPECKKGAQGSTKYCKAHGGGKRCTFPGCTRGAEGSTAFCKGHGGGKRCSFEGGCPKSVHGGTPFCVAHGGGKRCAFPECTKSARGRTNFCVRHGGGKRCQSEGCGKSAQGSTDFCKAHGGGKRCAWGQAGSELGIGGPPCEQFARGKQGLCASHSGLVDDLCMHGAGTMGTNPEASKSEKMKAVVAEEVFFKISSEGGNLAGWSGHDKKKLTATTIPSRSMVASLPEGRVHGGSLMAMLASNTALGGRYGNQAEAGTSNKGTPYGAAHKWV